MGTYADGREIAGGSFVALPNGNIGPVAGREQQVLVAELDRDLIDKTRERWPYLEDAKILERKNLAKTPANARPDERDRGCRLV
ncbi:MAG: hypothetical protein PWP65_217 [Clostridia bacterium]|nr:hypothetical protein [Clostridia bacterium]